MSTIEWAKFRNRPPCAHKRAGRRLGNGWSIIGIILLSGLLAGCPGVLTFQQARVASCSDARLEAANRLFTEAKEETVKHYRHRIDRALHAAYYASLDSIQLARSVRRCPDFNSGFRGEAIDLIRANILLQRMVKLNMRDPDPFVAVTLLEDEYHVIFNRDIDTVIVDGN